MAEFYAHESLAKQVAEYVELDAFVYAHHAAYLLGADGPDHMFFKILWRCGPYKYRFMNLGRRVHNARCDDFLCALIKHAQSDTQKAYTLGFLCHYALDQTIHPYVRYMSRPGGDFGMKGGHGYLEEAIDSTLYLMDHAGLSGLEPPLDQYAVYLTSPEDETQIDELLCSAINDTFKDISVMGGQFKKAFSHARVAKRMLKRPTPFKFKVWHFIETLLNLNCIITSHACPLALPTCDYMNLSHKVWYGDGAPEEPRTHSVAELLKISRLRARAYVMCAQEIWREEKPIAGLLKLTQNRSYNSDMPGSATD